MSRLFISHSSKDNVAALAFQRWLSANGWSSDDVFIDLHGIGAGERWRETLRKANAACEAVILLASPDALASVECQKELDLAEALGKEVIVAILRDLEKGAPALARYSERQFVDLSAEPRERMEPFEHDGRMHRVEFNAEALAKIKSRLDELGIAPGSFAWPPKDRPNADPYPGLTAFCEDDAGIFFGREADIMAALTEIRLTRRRRQPRLIVIQAASGAGKSSFLRAGLWPRLKRDPDFAPLAILRPAQGVVSGPDGLGQGLARFLERYGRLKAPGSTASSILNAEPADASAALASLFTDATNLATLARRAAAPEARAPAPLLGIDQAEELFAAENEYESSLFLKALTPLLKAPPPGTDPYVILTIRSDSVQSLLDRVAVLGLETPKPIYLPPLARESYREVILRPAEVYSARVRRLTVDPALAQSVVEEAKGADALPLLAFTLGQLYANYRQTGELTLANYKEMGGAAGSIRRALATAQARVGAAGSEAVLKRLIVPQLATWDPSADDGKGAAKRIVARISKVLDGDRMQLAPLATALVEQRLLTRGSETLEVAHEALLRQPPISGWLEDDRDFLMWRDRLAYSRGQYESNVRGLLVGRELQVARDWLSARPEEDVTVEDRQFVALSIDEDERRRNEEQERERRRQEAELELSRQRENAAAVAAAASRRIARRTMVGIAVSLMLAALAGWQWLQARNEAEAANQQRQEALTQSKRAAEGEENARLASARAEQESRRALSALDQAEAARKRAEEGEAKAFRAQSVYLAEYARGHHDKGNLFLSTLLAVEAMPDEKRGIKRPLVREAEDLIATSYYQLVTQRALAAHATTISSLRLMPDGKRALTTSHDATARLWDLDTLTPIVQFVGHLGPIVGSSISEDGRYIATASFDATARIWNATTGDLMKTLAGHSSRVAAVELTRDGKRAFTASADGTLGIWNVASGEIVKRLDAHPKGVRKLFISRDEKRLYSIGLSGEDSRSSPKPEWKVWNLDTFEQLEIPAPYANSQLLALSGDGSRLVVKVVTEAGVSSSVRLDVLDALSFEKLCTFDYELSQFDDVMLALSSNSQLAIIEKTYSSAANSLYSTVTGKAVATLAESEKGYKDFRFSPDGSKVYSSSSGFSDYLLLAWSTTDGAKISETKIPSSIEQMALSQDGHKLVFLGNNQLHISDKDGVAIRSSASMSTWESKTLMFDLSSRHLLWITDKGQTSAWDLEKLKRIGVLRASASRSDGAVFSPDSSIAAILGSDDVLQFFRLDPLSVLMETRLPASQIAFGPDGKNLIMSVAHTVATIVASDRRTVIDDESNPMVLDLYAIAKAGKRLFTANRGSPHARLWNLEAGQLIATITDSRTFTDVSFDTSGEKLLTVTSKDYFGPRQIRIYDAQNGRMLAEVPGEANEVILRPSGGLIVARFGERVSVIDIGSGKVRFSTPVEDPSDAKIVASPDGRRMVIVSKGLGKSLDTGSGKELGKFKTGGSVGSIDFSGDGRRFVIYSEGKVQVLETDTGRLIGEFQENKGDRYRSILVNTTGTRVICRGNGSAILYDGATGHRIAMLAEDSDLVGTAFVADGSRVFIRQNNGRLALLDSGTGVQVAELRSPSRDDFALSDDGRYVAVAKGQEAFVHDTATGRAVLSFTDFGPVSAFAFSGDSRYLAVRGTGGVVKLLDLVKATLIATVNAPDDGTLLMLDNGAAMTVQFGFDIVAIDTPSFTRRKLIDARQGGGSGFALGRDDRILVFGSGNGAAIWQLEPPQQFVSLAGHESGISHAAFSPDGQYAITGSSDGSAILWNAHSGQVMHKLAHDYGLVGVSFSADSRTAITTTSNGTHHWRVDTGEEIGAPGDAERLGMPRGASRATSPDGKRIAFFSGSDMKLIDAATNAVVLSIHLKSSGSFSLSQSSDEESVSYVDGPFEGVIVSPDGRTAVSTKTGAVWRMLWTTQDFVDFAKESLPRCLTLDERRKLYLDPEPPAWCREMGKWPYDTEGLSSVSSK